MKNKIKNMVMFIASNCILRNKKELCDMVCKYTTINVNAVDVMSVINEMDQAGSFDWWEGRI